MSGTRARENFHEEVETAINKQINAELHASYVYLALAAHFGRDDVELKGLRKFCLDSSHEEREHAEKLVKYLNLRGGRVVLQPIERPVKDEWDSGLEAMEHILDLEKQVNQHLLDIHTLASMRKDPHLTNFLEEDMLKEQAESVRKVAGHVTNLKRVGEGLGVFVFDNKLE